MRFGCGEKCGNSEILKYKKYILYRCMYICACIGIKRKSQRKFFWEEIQEGRKKNIIFHEGWRVKMYFWPTRCHHHPTTIQTRIIITKSIWNFFFCCCYLNFQLTLNEINATNFCFCIIVWWFQRQGLIIE